MQEAMKSPSAFMAEVRAAVPLVHHITNYVTVNDCANICICAGGSPVMTDAMEDVPDMLKAVSSSVLNIGTLNPRTVESMMAVGRLSHGRFPFVLDPVGAGATPYRTGISEELISLGPSVIKGNAGEIGVLSGKGGDVKGVDSHGAEDAASAAESLAEREGCIVVSTGEIDYVSDGRTTLRLSNGTDLLSKVSGTGCMLSSVVGCYVGACGATLGSAAAAVTAFNVAAEIASSRCSGPGTFKPALMDALCSLTADDINASARIERI